MKILPTTAEKLYSIFAPTKIIEQTLNPSVNKAGEITVSTNDGFQVRFTSKNQEWFITSPDNKTTRIWGDPHVEEADGDKWDFHKITSFIFGNNKITVETTPITNGVSYSKTVNIYNGQDRLSITDIDKDKLRLDGWSFDASKHDEKLSDGDVHWLYGNK